MAHLDTNVVVRLIVGDDAAQCKIAERLLAAESCWVSPTVLMETEWVLRAAYRLDAPTIQACISGFLLIENIQSTEPGLTRRALELYANGLDFADALHMVQTSEHEKFSSFDKKFSKKAHRLGLRNVQLLSAAAKRKA